MAGQVFQFMHKFSISEQYGCSYSSTVPLIKWVVGSIPIQSFLLVPYKV